MKILNIEDNMIKHNDICKVLKSCGLSDIDLARNLEDGLNKIHVQIDKNEPYDLVITDMWYPKQAGGEDDESGTALIEQLAKEGLDIPIILCSSVRYRISGILGAVHYSPNENWEMEIRDLIKTIN